ncbi:hypothetical protein Tco_1576823 [Tanacetum coccineum]
MSRLEIVKSKEAIALDATFKTISPLDLIAPDKVFHIYVFPVPPGKTVSLTWGRSPRLDSAESKYTFLSENIRSGAFAGQGSALIACLRIRTLFRGRPTEALGRGPIVRVQPRPRSLVCPLYVIKSPQSSKFIACDTLMHAVWLARLCSVARLCFRDSVSYPTGVTFDYLKSRALVDIMLYTKILSKDPPPQTLFSSVESERSSEFYETHTAPFQKISEPFLCWVGISRYYTLDENSYPTFWDGDEGRTVALDPPATAVSGGSSDSIDRLFDEGDNTGQEHSAERDDVQEEAIAKDASGVSLPPRTGEKSLTALRGIVLDGSIIPSDATRPAVTASVTPTPDVETVDSVSELNLRTRPSHVRHVVSSDSSLHLDSYSEAASLVRSVADAPVVTVVVTTTIDANVTAGFKAKDVLREIEHTGDSASAGRIEAGVLRAMDYDHLYSEFNVGAARQANLLSERDTEIAHLKSLLSLKEAEATEAISLRGQLAALEAADASKSAELRALKEKNFALEGEKNLNSKVASLESERDCLVTQRSSLESAFEFFKGQVEKMQDEQVGVLIDRVAAIDFDLMEMALHMDAEFYPRYLTTIAGRRWLLNRGLKLVLSKCLSSPEYLSAMGEAIGRAIDKGMQDCVSFPLLAQLEAHKDASMADIMDLLRLESPTTETSEARPSQPSLDELMIPIHRLEDQDSFRAVGFCKPTVSRVLTSEVSSSADVTVTTALATTFAQTFPIPAGPSTEVPPSPKIVFEEEKLDTTPEHALAP